MKYPKLREVKEAVKSLSPRPILVSSRNNLIFLSKDSEENLK